MRLEISSSQTRVNTFLFIFLVIRFGLCKITTMSNELAAVSSDIHVTAETPDQMKASNLALIQWCDHKITSIRIDHIELEASWKSAKEKKWKWTTLKRHANLAKKRMEFYRKIKVALQAGYFIVPNFPVTVFAIRSTKESPLRVFTTVESTWRPAPSKDQQTASLTQGEGTYQNPHPIVEVSNLKDFGGRDTKLWSSKAIDWKEIEFPICMSKPQIMEATNRAMQIKLFDDFGVLSDAVINRRGCGDPIIVGRIMDPRSTTWHHKFVSFIIAWHLDTKTL